MLSTSAVARVETWAQTRHQAGNETAVAELSALRALGAGRVDVFAWRPSGDPGRQEATLSAHGLRLTLCFRQVDQPTVYRGVVSDPRSGARWTEWSEDGLNVLRDLARLSLDVLTERRRHVG
jgi:hypothetical protein